jgi:membrane fusion protein, multidrug efflux system
VNSNEMTKMESNSPFQNGDDRSQDERSGKSFANPKVRYTLLVGLGVLLVATLAWYLRYQSYGKYLQSTDNAYVAADSVTVAPKIAGYVERVLVTENQRVRAGNALVQLDIRDYRAQTDQVEAQIAATLSEAETVRAQMREQDAAIAQARAQLTAAKAQAQLAVEQLTRYRPLAATGAEPREKLDQLETQSREARARVVAAQAAVAAANRRLDTLQKQVEQANSRAEAGRSQLEAARLNLESTRLRASIDGRIGDVAVRVGQFVQPGQRLMTLVPIDKLYVTANFKETQLGLVRPGQPVALEIDALPGVEVKGRVVSIAPGTGAEFSILPPENATGNFTKIVQRVPVRISIDARPEVRRLLVPGMSVEVTIDTRAARGELDRLREGGE